MVNVRYANAYKEVLVVINNLVKEDYDKIPKEYIDFLESNCNNDYQFEYDVSQSFNNQKLLDDTKYILFGLFEKFGATEKQKAKIKAFKNNYNNKLEEQKREIYNPDNLFKNKVSKVETVENSVAIVEYKKSNFTEIKNWFKRVF